MEHPPHVQTKREIEALLQSAGIHPRKRFGQHFLIDGNIMRRLVERAEISPEDVVLEVGGGTGGLTDLLVTRAARVICVEIDRNLFTLLADRFENEPRVTLIAGDVLERKHRLSQTVSDAIRACAASDGGALKLVANLPYQAATPLVMNLLIDYPEVRRLCFMVQAEVGERITASPGGRDYGPLSIIGQSLCRIETIGRVPPQAFWPRPDIASAMIRMDVGDPPFATRDDVGRFATFVRTVFEHRRKTLRSALSYAVDKPACDRIASRFDPSQRPETFTVNEWIRIFQCASE